MLNFSVVIPVYNEEASIMQLCLSLKNVMSRLGQSYEIIFVNDGSEDRSFEVLNSIDSKPLNLAKPVLLALCLLHLAILAGMECLWLSRRLTDLSEKHTVANYLPHIN